MDDDGKILRSNRKRPFLEDLQNDVASKPPPAKKVRFPKGKKLKKEGNEVVGPSTVGEEVSTDAKDARLAATERAKRRNQLAADLFDDGLNDHNGGEVDYQDNENFVEDGIQIEPFNLEKEREEGYFDNDGNFVEYVRENEIKDAWLDSVVVDPRYAGKSAIVTANEDDTDDDARELSSEDIGVMKRRIANLLEPGETVLQALRRLKGSSDNKKEKMSAQTQQLFDQLTEDANKLLDNDVYQEKQEVFLREAEGYERLAQARGKSTENNLYPSVANLEASSSVLSNANVEAPNSNLSTADISNSAADQFDMFADDDDDVNADMISSANIVGTGQPSSERTNTASHSGTSLDDYVYDESSGYYYSSSLGYYYDPNTGLCCQASSGQWYSYNEETGAYTEVHGDASTTN